MSVTSYILEGTTPDGINSYYWIVRREGGRERERERGVGIIEVKRHKRERERGGERERGERGGERERSREYRSEKT